MMEKNSERGTWSRYVSFGPTVKCLDRHGSLFNEPAMGESSIINVVAIYGKLWRQFARLGGGGV